MAESRRLDYLFKPQQRGQESLGVASAFPESGKSARLADCLKKRTTDGKPDLSFAFDNRELDTNRLHRRRSLGRQRLPLLRSAGLD